MATLPQEYKNGNIPLMLAIKRYSSNTELIKLLVQHGADPLVCSEKEGSLLVIAARHRASLETLQLLSSYGINVDSQDKDGKSAISYILDRICGDDEDCNEHCFSKLKALISAGASVPQNYNMPPITSSIDITDYLTRLLDTHRDLYINRSGYDNLLYKAACHNASLKYIKLLVDKGVDVNGYSWCGETAIYNMARHNSVEKMQVLFDAGAKIDSQLKIKSFWLNRSGLSGQQF
jgi:ankyrin repeat protein